MGYSDHGTLPKITNITFTDGVTEQSHIFTGNFKKFDISTRSGNTFRIAYIVNGTAQGGTYKTIPQDSGYFENFIKHPNLTVYLLIPNATTKDPDTIEILEWQSTD